MPLEFHFESLPWGNDPDLNINLEEIYVSKYDCVEWISTRNYLATLLAVLLQRTWLLHCTLGASTTQYG